MSENAQRIADAINEALLTYRLECAIQSLLQRKQSKTSRTLRPTA